MVGLAISEAKSKGRNEKTSPTELLNLLLHSAINQHCWFGNPSMTKFIYFRVLGFKCLSMYWILIIQDQK